MENTQKTSGNDPSTISHKTKRNDLSVISQKTKKNDLSVISHKTKRNDFIEIKFTGIANGQIFDSNVEEDIKKLNPEAKPQKTLVVIGQGMVVSGLDKALEDKEFDKEYEISFKAKEGFGERRRELMRTIPLNSFTQQKVNPQPGMVLALDNHVVKIIAVSGARVTADFNNPLAGKDLSYKFKIIRKVSDDKEKAETLFNLFFRAVPEFEVKEKSVIVKGPKAMESLIDHYKEKFKELMDVELKFEEKEEDPKPPQQKAPEQSKENSKSEVNESKA